MAAYNVQLYRSNGTSYEDVYIATKWGIIIDKPSWIGSSKPSYTWGEIGSKPLEFPPSSHNHSADAITSGTLNVARIPTLSKSKISNFDAEVLALSPAGSRPASDVPAWAKTTTLGTTGNPMVIGTTPESNLITSLTMQQLAQAMNISGNLPIIYGYSNTGVSTTAKVVSATSSSNPFTGYIKDQIYVIEFFYGNIATAPTININSAGAKTVRHLTTNGATTTNPGTDIFYSRGRGIGTFIYDGTYMILISYVSRHSNALETKMLGYSKPGSTSAITVDDSVSSAIGKLEKALDSIGGGGSGWVKAGTYPHSTGMIMLYPEGITEVFIVYSNLPDGKFTNMSEVLQGPILATSGALLPNYPNSYTHFASDYIEIAWDTLQGPGWKSYLTVFYR